MLTQGARDAGDTDQSHCLQGRAACARADHAVGHGREGVCPTHHAGRCHPLSSITVPKDSSGGSPSVLVHQKEFALADNLVTGPGQEVTGGVLVGLNHHVKCLTVGTVREHRGVSRYEQLHARHTFPEVVAQIRKSAGCQATGDLDQIYFSLGFYGTSGDPRSLSFRSEWTAAHP